MIRAIWWRSQRKSLAQASLADILEDAQGRCFILSQVTRHRRRYSYYVPAAQTEQVIDRQGSNAERFHKCAVRFAGS